MPIGRRFTIGVALLCLPLHWALAHTELPPGQSEIQINGKQLRLMMSIPSAALVGYDSNQDGKLSAAEVVAQRSALASHFLQAITVRGECAEVKWEMVTPALGMSDHAGHQSSGQNALVFFARGNFSHLPGTVEFSQRLWAPGYLQNQLAVLRVSDAEVKRREVFTLSQQAPAAAFFSQPIDSLSSQKSGKSDRCVATQSRLVQPRVSDSKAANGR